jgi:hypothetical protein
MGSTADRDHKGIIQNALELAVDQVAHQRVLCPLCRKTVFAMWPEGWDAHATYKCSGLLSKTERQRKEEFKERLGHLFR